MIENRKIGNLKQGILRSYREKKERKNFEKGVLKREKTFGREFFLHKDFLKKRIFEIIH